MSEETQTAAEATTEEQQTVGLQLNDIAACLQIIDLCSKRGAFEGSELEAVGKIRGKLATFVQAAMPPKAEEEEAAAEAEEPEAVEEDEDGPAVELG